MPSARENIREGVQTLLQRIILNNDSGMGYLFQHTLKKNNFSDPPTSIENMREFPFVNIFFGDEVCKNSDIGSALQTGGNRQLWHNSFDLVMDVYIKNQNVGVAQDRILADLQAVFGNDYTINNTVFACAYKSGTPFGLEIQKPNCGISITFTIWYRIYQTNPNVSG